jgi:hypothetical protein
VVGGFLDQLSEYQLLEKAFSLFSYSELLRSLMTSLYLRSEYSPQHPVLKKTPYMFFV